MAEEPKNLEELLDEIGAAEEEDGEISANAIIDAIGRRSFGPLLLLAGLIMVAPVIGDIPGVPTILGIFVILIAGQLLLHREHVWLPQWLLKRSLSRDKLRRTVNWIRPAARYIDRGLRSRWPVFVNGAAHYLIAVVCIVIAAATPVMEFVPFSANFAGGAFAAFGLALMTRDGLVGMIAFGVSFLAFGFVAYSLYSHSFG